MVYIWLKHGSSFFFSCLCLRTFTRHIVICIRLSASCQFYVNFRMKEEAFKRKEEKKSLYKNSFTHVYANFNGYYLARPTNVANTQSAPPIFSGTRGYLFLISTGYALLSQSRQILRRNNIMRRREAAVWLVQVSLVSFTQKPNLQKPHSQQVRGD